MTDVLNPVYAVRCTFPSGRSVLRTNDEGVVTYAMRGEAEESASRFGEVYPDHAFAVEEYDDGNR